MSSLLTTRGGNAKFISLTTLFMCVGEVQSANIVTEIAQEQTPFVRSMVVGLCVLAIMKLLLHLYRKHSMKRTASHVVTNDSSARGARYSLDPLSATVGVVVRVMYMSLKSFITSMRLVKKHIWRNHWQLFVKLPCQCWDSLK